jgi:hypothetical protein
MAELSREQVVERLKNMAEDGVVDESLLACYDALRAQVEGLAATQCEDPIPDEYGHVRCGRVYELERRLAAKVWAEIAQLQLKWTTEKPTRPGWYWWRMDAGDCIVEIDRDAHDNDSLYMLEPGPDGGVSLDILTGQWAGPIEPPGEERDEH